ncbi:MAG: TlpA disulfide reductase family protein [Bacteroidales bacterium]|nr:TlpA disulfide reductase family protein [Bacteroidales bacterium]
MNKLWWIIGMLCCLLSACSTDSIKRAEFANIQLSLTNGALQKVVVERIDPSEIITIDSVLCDHQGNALIRIAPEGIEMLLLQFSNHTTIPVLITKNSNISISADYKNISTSFTVEGGLESEYITSYFKRFFQDQQQSDSLAHLLNQVDFTTDDASNRNKLINSFNRLFLQHHLFADSMIRCHPSALSNLLILYQSIGNQRIFNYNSDSTLFFLVDDSLTKYYPENAHVLKNHERISEFRKTLAMRQIANQRLQVGNAAPDFSLPDIQDQPFTLNSLRGKTVLIVFWASWDMKFKSHLEILKTMYQDYKKYGFEIVAVSMDETKEFWQNAVTAQKTSWINVSDLKNTHSPLVKMYNLNDDLPIFYLIDENGIIIAQQPSMREIDDLLYEKLM